MNPNIEPEALLKLVKKKERNKYTTIYWLYKRKLDQGRMTEAELSIIEEGMKKKEHLFESTAADLIEAEKNSNAAAPKKFGTLRLTLNRKSALRVNQNEGQQQEPPKRLPSLKGKDTSVTKSRGHQLIDLTRNGSNMEIFST